MLIRSLSSSHTKNSNNSFEFSTTESLGGINTWIPLAKVCLNKKGAIKEIYTAGPLSSNEGIDNFISKATRWRSGACGKLLLKRPMFAHLPLKGHFKWNDVFQIRPITAAAKIGRGMDYFDIDPIAGENEKYLGPPFPFVLEIKSNKSDDGALDLSHGIKTLTEYESLLSVLVIHHVTTSKTIRDRQWTSVWNGTDIWYHLLSGGFDFGEPEPQLDFTAPNSPIVPRFAGNDYYDHLFGEDGELILPPNIEELLSVFEALQKPVRKAFLRACYWFSLGIENRNERALAIVMFSNAIECLLPRPGNRQCKQCLKPSGKGPTKLFNEHLEKYAPTLLSLEEQRNTIYEIRSALVHGSRLDAVDVHFFSPEREERNLSLLLEFTARRSLVNWLADPDRPDPTRSTDQQQ